jgi:hypothetical protein
LSNKNKNLSLAETAGFYFCFNNSIRLYALAGARAFAFTALNF